MATTKTRKAAKKTAARKPAPRSGAAKKDLAKTYNEVKTFEGQQYTGMKIGRSHKWHYDKGEWKEKKITPDEWEFNYGVVKRRGQECLLVQNTIGTSSLTKTCVS